MNDEALKEIISLLKKGEELTSLKKVIAKKYRLSRVPTNSQILASADFNERLFLKPLLRKKPVRTISGIAIVAVMTRESPCPGECIYCPQGEGFPKSYTGGEPAALRGKRLNFDPYLQVQDRLNQLESIGHNIDKIELIILGGTFNSQSFEYQDFFVKKCIDAMNDFSNIKKIRTTSLNDAKRQNEKSKVRNVGITFETRPDYCHEIHVNQILKLGVTRIELGVQSILKGVYRKVNRGHNIGDVIHSTRVARDAGLKVGYHMMPGLFARPEEDLWQFKELFNNPDFKPDFLKIYPTLVIKGTKLYKMWKQGEFIPYDDNEVIKLLVKIKKLLPKWTRTMRIQRDIPNYFVEAGVNKGNIGEIVYNKVKECKCIRCREIGHRTLKDISINQKDSKIVLEKYPASKGIEYFISAEDEINDLLIAYLRLRFPSSDAHRSEMQNSAVVRELRVLGQAMRLGIRDEKENQHKGFGMELLSKAEQITAEAGYKELLITSAIGTRRYYRKLGYQRVGPYMGKSL